MLFWGSQMRDLRACVKGLVGLTLLTTGQGKQFDVDAVEHGAVVIRVHSSGRTYRIPWDSIEAAEQMRVRGESLTPRALRDAGASEYHPAYVAAIFREIDGC